MRANFMDKESFMKEVKDTLPGVQESATNYNSLTRVLQGILQNDVTFSSIEEVHSFLKAKATDVKLLKELEKKMVARAYGRLSGK